MISTRERSDRSIRFRVDWRIDHLQFNKFLGRRVVKLPKIAMKISF